MTFEAKIRELSGRFLADPRTPDVAGFVDSLFQVAADNGAVGCIFEGDRQLRFFLPQSPKETASTVSTATRLQTACMIEHQAARTVLRMICARLAAICKEHTETNILPYGGATSLEYEIDDHKRWNVSFVNTPDRQEFLIEAT